MNCGGSLRTTPSRLLMRRGLNFFKSIFFFYNTSNISFFANCFIDTCFFRFYFFLVSVSRYIVLDISIIRCIEFIKIGPKIQMINIIKYI